MLFPIVENRLPRDEATGTPVGWEGCRLNSEDIALPAVELAD
jgi:hypothetical protein